MISVNIKQIRIICEDYHRNFFNIYNYIYLRKKERAVSKNNKNENDALLQSIENEEDTPSNVIEKS